MNSYESANADGSIHHVSDPIIEHFDYLCDAHCDLLHDDFEYETMDDCENCCALNDGHGYYDALEVMILLAVQKLSVSLLFQRLFWKSKKNLSQDQHEERQ